MALNDPRPTIPRFAAPPCPPGLRASLRSVRSVIDGWAPQTFAGETFRAALPGAPLIVADPRIATEVLGSRAQEFPHGELFNRLFRPVWGRGLFVAEGEEWRWQRHAAAPAFRPAHVAAIAGPAGASSLRAIAAWGEGPVELHAAMRALTLHILFETLFSGGEDFPDRAESSRHVRQMLDGVGAFTLFDMLPFAMKLNGRTTGRGGASLRILRSQVTAMVARRRERGGHDDDLLGLLLRAADPETGRRMDDALVCDNVMGFFAAGTDTSSNALAWALWLIARHPAVEARLVEEVRGVAGAGPILPAHLPALVYTRQVIREVQRLFPGAVAQVRAAAQNCAVDGHRVKRGHLVQIATYALHHRADLWAAPELFDPDRWGPEEPAPIAGSYLPFGAGPRICMGAAFAMAEMTAVLATLIRAVRFRPVSAVAPRLGIRLGAPIATEGLWMELAAR